MMSWVMVISLLVAGFAGGVLWIVHADGWLRDLVKTKRGLLARIDQQAATLDRQCAEIAQLRDRNQRLIAAREADAFMDRCIRATRKA